MQESLVVNSDLDSKNTNCKNQIDFYKFLENFKFYKKKKKINGQSQSAIKKMNQKSSIIMKNFSSVLLKTFSIMKRKKYPVSVSVAFSCFRFIKYLN